jgi:hypothetical protein
MRTTWLLLAIAACSGREPDSKPSPQPTRVEPPAPPTVQQCDPKAGNVCIADAIVECGADGTLGRTLQECKGACKRGACVDTCEVHGVELIYVVDSTNNLLSFDPQKLPADPFQLVGTLACDPANHPFSMAVDRTGVAWVLYDTGKLYRASILDGHCSPAGYAPEPNPVHTFGMGFVTDGPKSTTEQLFVAANDESQMLARLVTSQTPPRWIPIAVIAAKQTRNPELTGTGEGKLFGYFPEPGHGFVQELDRTTGKPLGPRRNLGANLDQVTAWAFALWGGVFYIFATTADGNSAVHSIRRKTGESALVREHLPYRIVGAGVSTCAPQLEREPP